MIKIDINDLDKYFQKGELIPAIAFDVDTKTVLMLAYMNRESLRKTLDTHGTGAVPDRNFGTRVPPAGTCRKSFLFTATATMIHFY